MLGMKLLQPGNAACLRELLHRQLPTKQGRSALTNSRLHFNNYS